MASVPVATNTLLSGTPAIVYSPTSGKNCWVDALTISNNYGSDVTVEIWRGNSSADSIVLPAKTLATGASYAVVEMIGQWILDGSAIIAKASVDSVVALIFSGREFAVPSS